MGGKKKRERRTHHSICETVGDHSTTLPLLLIKNHLVMGDRCKQCVSPTNFFFNATPNIHVPHK